MTNSQQYKNNMTSLNQYQPIINYFENKYGTNINYLPVLRGYILPLKGRSQYCLSFGQFNEDINNLSKIYRYTRSSIISYTDV